MTHTITSWPPPPSWLGRLNRAQDAQIPAKTWASQNQNHSTKMIHRNIINHPADGGLNRYFQVRVGKQIPSGYITQRTQYFISTVGYTNDLPACTDEKHRERKKKYLLELSKQTSMSIDVLPDQDLSYFGTTLGAQPQWPYKQLCRRTYVLIYGSLMPFQIRLSRIMCVAVR